MHGTHIINKFLFKYPEYINDINQNHIKEYQNSFYIENSEQFGILKIPMEKKTFLLFLA